MGVAISRTTLFSLVVAAVLLVGAAIAFACVPQRGKLDVTSQANSTEVNASASSNNSDWIVGDGDPDTRHFQSWCGDAGGHPVDAVWAGQGDTLDIEVAEAAASAVVGGPDNCPETANKLPTAGVTDGTFIYLENGKADGTSPNVYEWDETNNPGGHYNNGFWNFADGDGRGCYPPDRDPIEQTVGANPSPFTVNSNGSGTAEIDLQVFQTNDFTGTTGSPDPGDGASVLCVGENVSQHGDARAIFAPVVVTSV